MGDSGHTVSCTLCLYTGPDNDFEEIGEVTKILPAVFVKKNFQLSARKIVCHACKKKLQEAFHFKCSCICTEDFLVPFTAVAEPSEVDLREVYMKKNIGTDTRIADDQNVCRLCLGLVVGSSTFLLQDAVRQMVQNFIPELVLESTQHPVACEACTKSLYSHMMFINNCLYVRMNRSKSSQKEAQNTDATTHTNQDGAQKAVNTRSKSKLMYDLDLRMVKCAETDQIVPQTKPFSCDLCEFETKHQTALKTHKKCHKKHPKKKLYHCEECGYYTKYRNALKSHNLKHMRPSDIIFYRCEECDYKSKYRSALKSHELGHKKPSEIKMKKCDVCPYKTKHRTALVLHQLKHMRPSQIKMYKCNKCDFQTKYKHALKPHKSVRHKVGK